MFLSEGIVISVVSRCHFKATCAELYVYIVILYDRNLSAYKRHNHPFALEVGVLGVIRVDTHRGVSHDSLRAGSGYYGVCVLADNLVSEIVQLAVLFFVYHFGIAEGSLGFRIPVDHSFASVYQTFVIQIHKYLYDTFAAHVIHCKRGSAPVARSSEFSQLFQYYAAIGIGPVPRVFKELFARQAAFLYTLFGELGNHFCFGGY